MLTSLAGLGGIDGGVTLMTFGSVGGVVDSYRGFCSFCGVLGGWFLLCKHRRLFTWEWVF